MNVLLVGLGRWGENHLRVLSRLGVTLWVADVSPARLDWAVRDCVIVGERGALVADYGASTVTLHRGEHLNRGGVWEAVETGKEELPTGREEPLRLELQAFLDACAGRGPNLVPVPEGLRALAVVEAAGRAARLERTVQL